MPSKTNLKLNWKYALGEVLLIFIGISMAFALQQYANKRNEHKRSKEYLKAFSIELDENFEIIEEQANSAQRKVDLLSQYIEITNSDTASRLTDEYLTQMISRLPPSYYTSPSRASFEDIVNSGGFELISDPIIRRNMIRYSIFLTEYESRVEKSLKEWYTNLSPYFQKHADLAAMMMKNESFNVPKDLYSNDRDAFIRNREFTNILRARIIWQRQVVTYVESEREDIERFREQIKNYIGE